MDIFGGTPAASLSRRRRGGLSILVPWKEEIHLDPNKIGSIFIITLLITTVIMMMMMMIIIITTLYIVIVMWFT